MEGGKYNANGAMEPVSVECSSCKKTGQTRVVKNSCTLHSALWCILGGCICCLIPGCCKKQTEYKHFCNTCGSNVGVGIITSSNPFCSRCDQAKMPIEKYMEDAIGLAQIHVIDCEKEKKIGENYDTLEKVCGEGALLPHITFFTQKSDDISSQWPKDHIYQGAVDSGHFFNYMDRISESSVKLLDTLRLHRNFLDEKEKLFKVIYYTEDEKTPLLTKILSVQNRENISFGQIDSDNDKLKKKYPGIKNEKGYIFLTFNTKTKQYEESYFEGDIDSHKEINRFIQKNMQQSDNKIKRVSTEEAQQMTEVKKIKITKLDSKDLNPDMWVLLHLYQPGQPNPRFESLRQEYGAFFNYYESEITCQKCKDFALKQLNIEDFPVILAYPQGPKTLNQYIFVDDFEQPEELLSKMLTYAKSTEKVLYSEDENDNARLYKEVIETARVPIVFYVDSSDLKQKLFMNTLSYQLKYKKTVKFFKMSDPSEGLKAKMAREYTNGNEELPQIFGILSSTSDNKSKATRMDLPKTYMNYVLFIDGLVESRHDIRIKQTQLIDVTQNYQFENECLSSTTPCVIGMLSVHREARFDREKELLQQFKESFPKKKVKWAWMDGYCREEILKAAGKTTADLPTLIYLDNSNGKFQTLAKPWSQKNGEEFIQSLRLKKSVYQNIKTEFELGKRDCKKFNDEQKVIYEAIKQKQRDMKIERERKDKEAYNKLDIDYDEQENDNGLDQYGMKREMPGQKKERDDL